MKWWNEIQYNWRWWLTPRIRYAVITAVPSTENEMNCSDEFLVKRPFCTGFGPEGNIVESLFCIMQDFKREDEHFRARLPVFFLGEILIVNRNGREIAGRGRKPSKWGVECAYFWTLRGARRRFAQLLKEKEQ